MICTNCGKHMMIGELKWSVETQSAEFSCYHCGQKYKILVVSENEE